MTLGFFQVEVDIYSLDVCIARRNDMSDLRQEVEKSNILGESVFTQFTAHSGLFETTEGHTVVGVRDAVDL